MLELPIHHHLVRSQCYVYMDLASWASPSKGVVIGTTNFSSEVKEILSKFGWWHWRHRLACVPCHYKGQHKGWETCCSMGYFNCRFIFYFLFFGGMYNLEFVHTEKSISWWPTFKDILTLSSLFEKRKPILDTTKNKRVISHWNFYHV